MYVAPPMKMGAWSMARVLRQRIEYITGDVNIVCWPSAGERLIKETDFLY